MKCVQMNLNAYLPKYIIISKTALSEPQPSLEYSARFILNQTIRVSRFWTSQQQFLQSKAVSLASKLQPGRLGPCIYVPQ
jgi:hypothetical protein